MRGDDLAVTAQAGRGCGRRGLAQQQRGTRPPQRGAARQRQLLRHQPRLGALEQWRGGSLQNEFGALNALVLVTLSRGETEAERGERERKRERKKCTTRQWRWVTGKGEPGD